MKIEYKRNINKEVIMREEVFDYLMSMYHNYKKQKEVLNKIKKYAGELRLFDNESVEFEISNKILEILEEIK